MSTATLALVCSAAGGIENVGDKLIRPLLDDGWTVAVTATPTAAEWLTANGQAAKIEQLTGYPLRFRPRLPSEQSPHPDPDCFAVVPATANTVAKLALGLADNQALTSVCEAIGARSVPVVVFPRVNAGHAGQPAWPSHIDALTTAGVHMIYGPDVWPLHQPRSAPGRDLPWAAILDAIRSAVRSSRPGTALSD